MCQNNFKKNPALKSFNIVLVEQNDIIKWKEWIENTPSVTIRSSSEIFNLNGLLSLETSSGFKNLRELKLILEDGMLGPFAISNDVINVGQLEKLVLVYMWPGDTQSFFLEFFLSQMIPYVESLTVAVISLLLDPSKFELIQNRLLNAYE